MLRDERSYVEQSVEEKAMIGIGIGNGPNKAKPILDTKTGIEYPSE